MKGCHLPDDRVVGAGVVVVTCIGDAVVPQATPMILFTIPAKEAKLGDVMTSFVLVAIRRSWGSSMEVVTPMQTILVPVAFTAVASGSVSGT